MSRRRPCTSVLAEPDGHRQIEMIAANSCTVKRRIGPMLRAIRSARETDPDGAALWALIQSDFHANQRGIVEAIASHGNLRPDIDVDAATDILWTLNHPDVWLLLTGERGWTPEAFETWFRQTLTQQLLERSIAGDQSGR